MYNWFSIATYMYCAYCCMMYNVDSITAIRYLKKVEIKQKKKATVDFLVSEITSGDTPIQLNIADDYKWVNEILCAQVNAKFQLLVQEDFLWNRVIYLSTGRYYCYVRYDFKR